MRNSKIWAITSYFNPMNYSSRRNNYREFLSRLDIPLLAVELSSSGSFDLDQGDADVVVQVQVRDGSMMWQKERLLNIALAHLPEHVEHVAWIDCDVVFENRLWFEEASRVLSDVPVAQCFSKLVDLGPGGEALNLAQDCLSVGYMIANKMWENDGAYCFETPRRVAIGLAWAARREVVQQHGFYDAMIVGGGDRSFISACIGAAEHAADIVYMSNVRKEHYLQWAKPVFQTVRGQVGFVEGTLFHLWHGAFEERRYLARHRGLSKLDFQPDRDLRHGESGAWEWTEESPVEVRDFLRQYLSSRNEDGKL